MSIAQPVLELDELYVVSDLHLGGETGYQIFASGTEFASLVEHLIGHPKDRRVGLLINGDFVDFLAQPSDEPTLACFDPDSATRKLERIKDAPEFHPVWSALRKFVRTPNRILTLNIGNHDLELAIPWVREHLYRLLTDGDDAPRGRLRVETDGTGVLCRVGAATVLCVHGNEVDPWNSVDHGKLSRVVRDIVRGTRFDGWTPNGGSKLVIDVINELKRQHYHFVDLLKPEGVAVFEFLTALGAKLADKAGDAAAAQVLMRTHQAKAAMGMLGSDQPDRRPPARQEEKLDGADMGATTELPVSYAPVDKDGLAESLLRATEDRFREKVQPIDLLPLEGAQDAHRLDGVMSTLIRSVTGAFRGAIARKDEMHALREALMFLTKDRSFVIDYKDETFRALDEKVGTDIDILVAGHTHLERAIPRGTGKGFYYNTGTWARLMQITGELLEEAVFEQQVYPALEAKSMGALENAGLLMNKRTVVSIRQREGRVAAELTHWAAKKAGKTLTAVPGTSFSISS